MKILFFLAKTIRSNTLNQAEKFLSVAKGSEDLEVVVVTEKDMTGHCNGCRACYETGSCRHKDRLSSLLEEEFDAIIIASPVYFFGLSSIATQFLHRTYVMRREGLVLALILSHGSKGYFSGVSIIEEQFKRLDAYSGSITLEPFHKATGDKVLDCTREDEKGLRRLLEEVKAEVNRKHENSKTKS